MTISAKSLYLNKEPTKKQRVFMYQFNQSPFKQNVHDTSLADHGCVGGGGACQSLLSCNVTQH